MHIDKNCGFHYIWTEHGVAYLVYRQWKSLDGEAGCCGW